MTHPYPIGPQLQIPQLRLSLQALDPRNLILNKVQVRELSQVVYPLDMLDLIERQVQNPELRKRLQALNMRYQVIVKIELF
jgi:hypothetical protein